MVQKTVLIKVQNQSTIKDCFIKRLIGPHVLRQNQSKSLLFLDNATCHTTPSVRKKLNNFKIKLEMIPPRMTGIVQPADVGWMKSIKAEYHRKWTNWYIHNDHAFTKAGNLKSPGYVNVCITEHKNRLIKLFFAFKAIQWKSFDLCGITSNNNLNESLRLVLESQSKDAPNTFF